MGEAAGRVLARDPKEIVARGYDAIALHYAEWAGRIESPLLEWVRDFDARLPNRSNVLELGCGRGVPVARELARRHQVTGVDISAVQIELARHHVPEASFVHIDAMELDVAAASVDGVLALHLFGHIPMHEQPCLIERIGSWLRPGGHLLATLGAGTAGEMVEDDWLGAPMFFASLDTHAYPAILKSAGFDLLRDEVVVLREPGHGEVAFRWVLARVGEAA
jgi:SAM-dependent methyltransferase